MKNRKGTLHWKTLYTVNVTLCFVTHTLKNTPLSGSILLIHSNGLAGSCFEHSCWRFTLFFSQQWNLCWLYVHRTILGLTWVLVVLLGCGLRHAQASLFQPDHFQSVPVLRRTKDWGARFLLLVGKNNLLAYAADFLPYNGRILLLLS